jgi:hypothetical protein
VPVLVTTDHGSIHCHRPATVFAKRDTTQNLRYKFGADLRARTATLAMTVKDDARCAFRRARRRTNYLVRLEGRLLRLSHQAAAVPGALPGLVPPRRGITEEMILPVAAADPAMKLYLRILRYVRPHLALFAWAILAMTFYAALDAFSFTLLIPFLTSCSVARRSGAGRRSSRERRHRRRPAVVRRLADRRAARPWRGCATW